MGENLIQALAKGAIAGLVVTGILLLKDKHQIAGILVMMPVITASSFLFVGLSNGPRAAQQLALSALFAVPTAAVFIGAMYLLLGRLGVVQSLLLSSGLWAMAAATLIWMGP
jgi:uncharacterized membrane protein (GlpM family)